MRNVEIPYSEFKAKLAAGELADVTVGPVIEGLAKGAAHVVYWAARPPNPIGTLIMNWLFPLLVLATLWSLASRNLAGRVGGGIFGAGKSKATEVKASDVGVTFKDVGGADEAIGELQEIIQFLQTPQRFARLGGRIPNGVLLVGPPGTGKMLIAKATTGEAGVRFFETSGSEFVEMFVGVGAARVYAICSRRPGRPRRRSNVWSADSSSAAA